MFFPVFRPGVVQGIPEHWKAMPEIRGCMVNAYFLYRQRDLRKQFEAGLTSREYLQYDGILCTDSGAFQGFTQKLILHNSDIVRFQDTIRTDIAAPLDLVTPPTDKRTVALAKLLSTEKRTAEAMSLAPHCLLAGIQQGGRYFDLRQQSLEGILKLNPKYLGIGSLVPFLNKNHDMAFVAKVIRAARDMAGPDLSMHIYGAGDPVEIPFMVACGADIFDSSSYGHYAAGGWYMTPFGALNIPGPLEAGEYHCECPDCMSSGAVNVLRNPTQLISHNLWTICKTITIVRAALKAGTLDDLLRKTLEQHQAWFPNSALRSSWEVSQETA